MKITTWNINGLRAAFGKEFVPSIERLDTDVLCLQEIKARPEQLENDHLEKTKLIFPCQVWNPAQRPGYSGVATLARRSPVETICGWGNEKFDIEGRVIRSEFLDFYLYNIYFPNGQRDQGRLTYKLDFYAQLLEICDSHHAMGKNVILCGDFNTAHREIDLRNPKQNQKTSGFLPEERAWIDRYLEQGFVDAFRFLYPDRVQYTWWTYITNARARNIGWRLDYFLVSRAFLDRIEDVIIHDEILGSDHCPVSILIREN